MNENTSLQNLNDIVAPAAAGWLPLAPGWYVVGFLLLVLMVILGFRQGQSWRDNRYRRAALAELQSLRSQPEPGKLQELPALLKRAALSRWPREQVASLAGADWHRFLDDTAGKALFCDAAGQTLDRLAYSGNSDPALFDAETGRLLDASEFWLRHHRIRDGEAT